MITQEIKIGELYYFESTDAIFRCVSFADDKVVGISVHSWGKIKVGEYMSHSIENAIFTVKSAQSHLPKALNTLSQTVVK